MKILILTASPDRDKLIDEMIREELVALGHEVWVRPCLREGRQAVLELTPDVVVVPPIRNPYSRDLVETMKGWGIAVVSRHTEASMDWPDFKRMTDKEKQEILGAYPYVVDCEIVWGGDEADILNRRGVSFKAVPVGAFVADAYLRDDLASRVCTKDAFFEKFKLDKKKKVLCISAAWGFADSAPDLRIDEIAVAANDTENRNKNIAMIKHLYSKLNDKWNIIVKIHPGVNPKAYSKGIANPEIPIIVDTLATEVVYHSDAMVHSGSTMAMEMHFLNKPSFQYGDGNKKITAGWWLKPESPLSRISPNFTDLDSLTEAIATCKKKSNADKGALKELAEGRYGTMDGQAAKRAANIISQMKGQFKLCWPKAHRNYDQPLNVKSLESVATARHCGICGNNFYTMRKDWAMAFAKAAGVTNLGLVERLAKVPNCPHCATRLIVE